MARPIKHRKTNNYSEICFPQSVEESSLTGMNIILCRPIEITLFSDEVEALRLRNICNLSQTEIAKKMKISQPTVARTLKKTYKKITKAIIEGKTIKIKSRFPHDSEKNQLNTLFAMQRLKN